jgi:UDP-glucose 4-epimerase
VRIVVTGGAGFIGANLCKRLVNDGHTVTCLDDLSTGCRQNLDGLDVELCEGSILDTRILADACEAADAIVHLAARPSVPRSLQDPVLSNEVNVRGTLNVLEQARREDNAYVVIASSSSVYGSNPQLPKHEDLVPQPLSPYAVSKLAAESYGLAYQACFRVPVLPLRFFNVYGPLQPARHAYAAVVPTFIDAAIRGVPLPVNGDGTQSRDFTYVGSVVAILSAAVNGRVTSPTPVNLAFGSCTSLLDLVALIEDLVGYPLEREHHAPRLGDVLHSQADQRRLRALFPDAEPVSLRTGLEETLRWFHARYGTLITEVARHRANDDGVPEYY